MKVVRQSALSIFALSLLTLSFGYGPESIVITPSTFDFGWCPDNAKISADFVVKNIGADLIPITSVEPTCGCTASNFTPGGLASNEETKVSLTFNTRGYAGSSFNKPAKVKTEAGAAEYVVNIKGHVLDPKAMVAPDQGGVAEFSAGAKEKKKVFIVSNKGAAEVKLAFVQTPASWAKSKLSATQIKPGATAELEVSVSGSLDETKDTSLTIEATSETGSSRFTVAIRTGTPPPAVKRSSTAAPAPAPAPTKK